MKARNFSILFVVLVTVFLIAGSALTNETTAFEPLSQRSALAAPALTVTVTGTTVSLSWTSVADATGYTLYYAPYPKADPIGNIPMGDKTSMSASLPDGSAFYVALQAYNSFGNSGYSNIEYFVINIPIATSPIPDTGQTKCYNNSDEITCPQPGQDFSGQDANYIINPLSYTKLDANGNTLSASATSWSMVKDNVTGLIWEVKTDGGSIHDMYNKYTWQGAQDTFVASLNSARFGGYADWRLPTIRELAYIVNYGTHYPAIDTGYFPNTLPFYWSSTTNAQSTSYARGISFPHGDDTGLSKSVSVSSFVRAVRGGQSTNSFEDNGNGTVLDTSTGLMWQQATASGTYTWKAALSYCEEFSFAGYTDWRLPSIKELRSIVNYDRYSPAIDTSYFPDTLSRYYWSSTTDDYNTSHVWLVHFFSGNSEAGYYGKSDSYYVRAVRGGQ